MIELDGTPNKGRLGANAILGVSLATARAAAAEAGQPLYDYFAELYAATGAKDAGPAELLPVPMMNVLNGGAHADNAVDFQEFMVVPAGAPTFADCLRVGSRGLPRAQGDSRQEGALDRRCGDEGGFAPDLESNQAALDFLIAAIEEAGYAPGEDVVIALDPATSELYEDGNYVLEHEGRTLTSEEMAEYWHDVRARFHVVSIEDGMDEEDWDGWKALTERIGDLCQLVGDDLFVTNPERLRRGIELGVANSILIKVNQIGTLTETLEAIQIARDAGYTTVISHRSGETEDTTIADLAVGTRRRSDQDRRPIALGSRGEVQPPAPHRGGARRPRQIPRRVGLRALRTRRPAARANRAMTAGDTQRPRHAGTRRRVQQPGRAEPDPLGPARPDRPGARAVPGAGLLPEPAGEPAAGLAGVEVERRAARPAQAGAGRADRASCARPRARPRSSARRAAWAWSSPASTPTSSTGSATTTTERRLSRLPFSPRI